MPTFPDGSRVWINSNGKPLEEYQLEVEVNEEQRTHLMSVYIESEHGQEFSVAFSIAKSQVTDMRKATIRVDGINARGFQLTHDDFSKSFNCLGWPASETTTRAFTFCKIDTDASCDESSYEEKKQELLSACVELEFLDVVITSAPETPSYKDVAEARAVHPDSKLACIVGTKIKPGQVKVRDSPATWATHVAVPKDGAVKYTARFFYRPKNILSAMSIIPKLETESHIDSNAEKITGSNAKERKRKADAEPEAGASAGGSEDAEERKKRLRAQLIAIKQELGEDLGEVPGSSGSGDAAPKVKSEAEDPNRPINQKIFIDLSSEYDTSMDA